MAQVIIRNLDDDVVSRLKAKAEFHGHSLEQELREILTRAAPLAPAEKLAIADRIRAMTPGPADAQPDSTDLIREWRDRGYDPDR